MGHECRNLIKKPLDLCRVLNRDPIFLGIQNQGFLNKVPRVAAYEGPSFQGISDELPAKQSTGGGRGPAGCAGPVPGMLGPQVLRGAVVLMSSQKYR